MVVTGACGLGADTIAERTNALKPVKGHLDFVVQDSVDCGTFIDNFTDYYSVDTLDFYDSNGVNTQTVWHFDHTSDDVNSVTGYTLHEKDKNTLTFDWINGTITWRGKIFSMINKGEGMVLKDVGRVILDLETHEVLFSGGRHDVLSGAGDQAFCDAINH